FVNTMIDNKWLGSKTEQGFYKKVKNADGSSEILTLDLGTLNYRSSRKANFATLELTKTIDKVVDRCKLLVAGKDKTGEFYRKSFAALYAYVSHSIQEINNEHYKIDGAMKAGFGWEQGPFLIWYAIGVEVGLEMIGNEGLE